LRACVPQYNSGQISRTLRRLRTHGLLKKVNRCYKNYLTALGKQVTALGLSSRSLEIKELRSQVVRYLPSTQK